VHADGGAVFGQVDAGLFLHGFAGPLALRGVGVVARLKTRGSQSSTLSLDLRLNN
jgi:hypothetical protein